jgi:hypothetical protein
MKKTYYWVITQLKDGDVDTVGLIMHRNDDMFDWDGVVYLCASHLDIDEDRIQLPAEVNLPIYTGGKEVLQFTDKEGEIHPDDMRFNIHREVLHFF